MDDIKREKPQIEIKKVWAHGDHTISQTGQSRGKDCSRADKPVYTDPGKVPGICKAYDCYNDEWVSRGKVIREKATKKVLTKLP